MIALAGLFLLAASPAIGRPGRIWLLLFIGFIAFLVILAIKLARRPKPNWSRFPLKSSCPAPERWQEFLKGRVLKGEHYQLAVHLENCGRCQQRVEGLVAGKQSWVGIGPKLRPQPPTRDPALQKIMDELKAEEKLPVTQNQPALRSDLPLGFLDPPEKTGHLGRLGRYEVLEEIGRGGMGIVLKAVDPSLQRIVAIKVLSPHLATSGVARKRFMREAQAAAAVSHDHVVTIHAVEETKGLPHLVMQYVPGMSLQDRIDKDGPIGLKEILRIGMQTASGLAAAHAQGLVHRDIKPANILLENGVQRVKITDFGLARAVDDASLTQSGFVAGSPQFMAPEQARGEAIDHRSDLFSLGSVLYTLCTGRPPFRATTTLAILRRVSDDAPRPIREINPEIPEWLEAIIVKLHAKNPDDRFQTAGEVADLLSQHLAQLQQGAPVLPPPAQPAPPAGSFPNAGGLLTSFTICPSCGSQLHVPENWVGSTVDCPDCGKPFRVEDGSDEIQVARPIKAQTIHPPRSRRTKVSRTWLLLAFGGALVFLVFMAMIWTVRLSSVEHSVAMESIQTSGTPVLEENPASLTLPWYVLYWFPEDATLFGAIDFRRFGPFTLDDEFTQMVLKRMYSPEIQKLVTTENLGNVRIDFIGFAYYEDPLKPENSRIFLRLTGEALAGRKRFKEFFKKNIPDANFEEQASANPPYTFIHSPKMPFAVCLMGDTDVILAGFQGKKESREHLQVVKQIVPVKNSQQGSILTGNQPPWLRYALKERSANACGVLFGEIPEEFRTGWKDMELLPVIPRSVAVRMIRGTVGNRVGDYVTDFSDSETTRPVALPDGVASFKLEFNLEKANAADQFVRSISDRQKQGIDAWNKLSLNWNIPLESFEPINRFLGKLRLETQSGMVKGTLRVEPEEWKAFLENFK